MLVETLLFIVHFAHKFFYSLCSQMTHTYTNSYTLMYNPCTQNDAGLDIIKINHCRDIPSQEPDSLMEICVNIVHLNQHNSTQSS